MYATDDTSADYYQSAKNVNNYGGMQYYSSSTCYSIGFTGDSSGCTGNYNQSHIKYKNDVSVRTVLSRSRSGRASHHRRRRRRRYRAGVRHAVLRHGRVGDPLAHKAL